VRTPRWKPPLKLNCWLQEEEPVQCRIDHYQTLDKIQVSIFAKKVDKEQSSVNFEDDKVGFCFTVLESFVLNPLPGSLGPSPSRQQKIYQDCGSLWNDHPREIIIYGTGNEGA
jgi:CS domain